MKHPVKRSILAVAVLALFGAGLAGCGGKTESDPDAPPATVQEGALTVEEYAIVEDSVDKPTHFEFMDRVDSSIREKRKAVRESQTDLDVASMTATLERFGYELRTQDQPGAQADAPVRYGLYKGDELILGGISQYDLSPVVVNESGTDWFLLATVPGEGTKMVRSGKVQPWDMSVHLFAQPVYVGDDLLWAESHDQEHTYQVLKEGEVLYEDNLPEWAVDNAFKGLVTWDDHWAVEVRGDVIVDGVSIAKSNGYDEVFNLRLIKGRPFYFYAKDGKVHLSYDGQTLPQTYDRVIHYECCEPSAFNPSANDSMIWFWALKGTMWHYVEAGIYE